MRIVLLWFVLMIAACTASSQIANYNLRFQTLTIDDGLTQNMVRTMLVDKTGFLWIGTSDGLNRFDGTDFVHFRHNPDEPESLPDNQVLSLFEDSGARIWIGTSDGVAIYDPTTEIFRRIAETKSDDPSKNPVHSIAEDPYGNIWLGSSKGLFKVAKSAVNELDEEPSEMLLIEKFPAHAVEAMARTMVVRISSSGQVYMGCNSGLFVGKASENKLAKEEFRQISNTPVSHMAIDRRERVWYGSSKLYIYRPIEGNLIESLSDRITNGSALRAIELDAKGAVWVSVYNFTEFEESSTRLYKFDPETLVPDQIDRSNQAIISLAFTRSDLVWGGTAGYGLLKGDLKSAHFSVHNLDSKLHELRNPKSGAFFFIQKGNPQFVRIPTGTRPTKTYFDPLSERDMPFVDNHSFSTQSHLPTHISLRFSHKSIRDDRGHYWVFENSFDLPTQLSEYDPSMGLIRSKDFNLPAVQLLYFDSKGKLWISLGKEIALFNEKDWTFQNHIVLDQPNSATTISTVLSDRQGIFWLGTDEGLVRYDPASGASTHYRNLNPALDYGVLSLLNDPLEPDEYLWVGTEGGGLIKLQKSTGTTKRFTEKDGLPNLVIYGILPDENGHLWISTNNGLVKIDTRQLTTAHFSKEDGLPTNEFNRFIYGLLEDGRLWFESLAGIVAFRPADIMRDTMPPPIVFTQIKAFNEVLSPKTHPKVLSSPAPFAEHVFLPWDQNVITWQYATLDFRAPHKNRYSTMLEGVDKAWSPPVPERSSTYANLSPGTYTFRVRATNSNGFWNEEGIAMKITIGSPWWLTHWAYAIYAMLLIGAIYAIHRIRINRIRLQFNLNNQRLEASRLIEIDRLKDEFFSNITHEFRTPITLIINPIQRLLSKSEKTEERTELRRIHRSATQLLRLINQLLDLSKIDSGMMRIDYGRGEVIRFLREIVDSFAPLATSKQIALKFKSEEVEREILFDPSVLEKIAYNFVSNAIKYTPKNGRVDVAVRFELSDGKDGFYFEVRDNGPGVNPEDEKRIFDRYYRSPSGGNGAGGGTGIGLALVRELVRLYGGTVHLSSQVGEGSAFSVWLPLPQPAKYHSQLDGQHEHIAVDLADEDDQRIGGIEGQDKPVVLIVEDNDDLRGFLNTCLVEHYAVMEASNGEEALELAFAHIPDAVVCDLMMPVMDGLEFLEKLKANERTSHVPVILLTAKTSRTDRESALAKGADAYLTKPFYETELLALLNNLLQIRTQTWNLHRAQVMKVRKEGQSNSEETFIAKLRLYIEEHMADATFDTESLSRATAMSRTQLHRKLKAITGISTGVLIRKIRIERARELLEIRESNISEVAYQTGFNTHSYFSRCFAEEYGMSPTEYQKQFGSSNGEMVD